MSDVQQDVLVKAVFAKYDFYVDATAASDEGDGLTWATSKRTLQAAVDLALDGETVHVADGTYEPVSVEGEERRLFCLGVVVRDMV